MGGKSGGVSLFVHGGCKVCDVCVFVEYGFWIGVVVRVIGVRARVFGSFVGS